MGKKEGRVLIVDDEESVCFAIQVLLEPRVQKVVQVHSGHQALEALKAQPFDLVITDYNMPKMTGMELLHQIKANYPAILVLMMTAFGNEKLAVEAIKGGAYDYIPKPFDNDFLGMTVDRALGTVSLATQLRDLKQAVGERYDFHSIIGKSPAMQRIYDVIEKIAENRVTVLITGENGTGKEMICRAIHFSNPHSRDKPFIKLNCAALPENLIESELFGYEKGAFTDAIRQKPGKFEQADGGTLFLDEIGDMSLVTQAKILRVLQEQEFERIGGTKSIKVAVRIIAATNKDLKKAIERREFREDLYFRLNIVNIQLPPLRERREDIPLLLEHFLAKYSEKFGKEIKGRSPAILSRLIGYDWPGNIREMENTIERAIVLSTDGLLSEDNLFLPNQPPRNENAQKSRDSNYQHLYNLPFKEAKNIVVSSFESAYMEHFYREAGGNISRAAQKAGMHRKNFYEKLKEYNIEVDAAQIEKD